MRQLESMIRLSEAMAKMSCCDTVEPKHVQEAFRLLNKSIIRVETPDIDFEDDEVETESQKGVVKGVVNGVNGKEEDEGSEVAPQGVDGVEKTPASKVRVAYEEYKIIANLLIHHLRRLEESGEGIFNSL